MAFVMMITEKPKRKNPWTKRRARQKFNERNQKIDNSPIMEQKIKQHFKLINEIKVSSEKLKSLRAQYIEITDRKVDSVESIIDGMTIETLKDSIELEKYGIVTKPQFRDFLKASKIKKQGKEIIDQENKMIFEARIAQIEIIQAKIDALDKILEEEEHEI